MTTKIGSFLMLLIVFVAFSVVDEVGIMYRDVTFAD